MGSVGDCGRVAPARQCLAVKSNTFGLHEAHRAHCSFPIKDAKTQRDMQNRCRSLLSPSPSPIRTVIGNCGNSVAPNMHINFIASNNKSIDNNCETHLIVVLKGGNNAADSRRRKLRCLAVADWAMLYNY